MSKIQTGQPFLGRGKYFENCQEYIPDIPCGSRISTKSLYLAQVSEMDSKICVLPFLAYICKMAAIVGEGKFFGPLPSLTIFRYTVWSKMSTKSLYLSTVKEMEAYFICHF